MPTTPDVIYQSPQQVAARMGFKTARPVYARIAAGDLPAKRFGTRILIDPADVDALLVDETPTHPRPAA